ncbi:MAG: glycosyltransferase family 1 protein [candidate division WOR-3 bacterium]
MKVVISSVTTKIGGGVTTISHLTQELSSLDRNIRYIVFVNRNIYNMIDKHISKRNLVYMTTNYNKIPFLNRLWFEQFILARMHNKEYLCVLISFNNICCFFWPGHQIVLIQSIAPFLKEAQDGKGFYNRVRYFILNLLTRLSFRYADIVIVNSKFSASLVLHKGCPKERIRIIPLGLNKIFLDKSKLLTAACQHRDGYILTVGNLYRHKNFEVLIKSVAELLHRGYNWPFYIVGSPIDFRYYEHLKALADSMKVSNLVKFIGPVDYDDLPSFYTKASAFVLVSKAENFPYPLIEAMACGCPIIASRQIPTEEICGEAALLCDAYDPIDVANKIEKVMTDNNLYKKMQMVGLKRVKRYNWHDIAKQYYEIIMSLIDSGNKSPKIKQ